MTASSRRRTESRARSLIHLTHWLTTTPRGLDEQITGGSIGTPKTPKQKIIPLRDPATIVFVSLHAVTTDAVLASRRWREGPLCCAIAPIHEIIDPTQKGILAARDERGDLLGPAQPRRLARRLEPRV